MSARSSRELIVIREHEPDDDACIEAIKVLLRRAAGRAHDAAEQADQPAPPAAKPRPKTKGRREAAPTQRKKRGARLV